MKILSTLFLLLAVLLPGCSSEGEPRALHASEPTVVKLDSLLSWMNTVQYLNTLPEPYFDTLIVWLAAYPNPKETPYEALSSVLDKIALASEGDSYFIEVLLRLDAAVPAYAELSESLPQYIEKGAMLNPPGFTLLYRGFTEKRRREAIGLLTYLSNPKIVLPFRDLANSSRDPAVRQLAGIIADSLQAHVE